jgi:FkbM family methyltransferase
MISRVTPRAVVEALLTKRGRAAQRWIRSGNDKTLRLEYDLGPESTVLDLGGYQGQWASDIFARYLCTVHVFEPMPAFADNIERRFARNARIKVHRFGLAGATGAATLNLSNDASSMHRSPQGASKTVPVRLVAFEEFQAEYGVSHVDLMKINIEGAEYELLEHLLDAGLAGIVSNIQVQFHDFVPRAIARMKTIRRGLERTHKVTYQSDFVWENWQLKS